MFSNTFKPLKLYKWHDGYRSFSLLDVNANLHFAHWLQELDDCWIYLVVPVNQENLDDLLNNQISYYDFLALSKTVFLVTQDTQNEQLVSTVKCSWDEVSSKFADSLPKKGTFYNPSKDKEWYESRIPHDEGEIGVGTAKNKNIIKYVESEDKNAIARVKLVLGMDETGEFVMTAEQVQFLRKVKNCVDDHNSDKFDYHKSSFLSSLQDTIWQNCVTFFKIIK